MVVKKSLGVAEQDILPGQVLSLIDYVEIKQADPERLVDLRARYDCNFWLHLQYDHEGEFISLADHRLFQRDTAEERSPAFNLRQLQKLVTLVRSSNPLPWCSFHFGPSASVVEADSYTYGVKARAYRYGPGEVQDNTKRNLERIREALPSVDLLMENVEYQPDEISGGAYRYVGDARFIAETVRRLIRSGHCQGLVLDIAHAAIAANNHPAYNGLLPCGPANSTPGEKELATSSGYVSKLRSVTSPQVNARHYLDVFPLDAVREIHISGPRRLDSGLWIDAHEQIGPLELDLLHYALSKMENAESVPITLEYVRDPDRIAVQLLDLQRLKVKFRRPPRPVPAVDPAGQGNNRSGDCVLTGREHPIAPLPEGGFRLARSVCRCFRLH